MIRVYQTKTDGKYSAIIHDGQYITVVDGQPDEETALQRVKEKHNGKAERSK